MNRNNTMKFFLSPLSRHLLVFALIGGLTLFTQAEPLPAPNTLAAQLGKAPQNLTVLEPHLLAADLPAKRTYQGYPASQLLDHVLGKAWRAPGNEVAFLALDGYVSRIPSEDIVRHEPLLAIAIRGQTDFTVDNPLQRQMGVPLGPYYLVWDNLRHPRLRERGGHIWPYQVAQVRVDTQRKESLLHPGLSEADRRTAKQVQEACLSCHQIQGYGGQKMPTDLTQLAQGLSEAEFVEKTLDPAARMPNSTMPPLLPKAKAQQRQALARQMHHYLRELARLRERG